MFFVRDDPLIVVSLSSGVYFRVTELPLLTQNFFRGVLIINCICRFTILLSCSS